MIWLLGGELKTECSRIVTTLFRSKSFTLYHTSRKTPRACPENSTTEKKVALFYSFVKYISNRHTWACFFASQVSDWDAKYVVRNVEKIKENDKEDNGGHYSLLPLPHPRSNRKWVTCDVKHTFNVHPCKKTFKQRKKKIIKRYS